MMKMFQTIINVLLVVFLYIVTLNQVGCLKFSYPNFNETVVGDFDADNSYIVEGIQVTQDISYPVFNLSGKIVYKHQFELWNKGGHASFNSTFDINIKNRTDGSGQVGPIGEGLAFIIAEDRERPNNSEGQWLGIVNASTNGSLESRIVAVEFDTKKSFPEDLDDNHVGLDINSVYSEQDRQFSLDRLGIRLATDVDITVMVIYDGANKVMNVSVLGGNLTEFSQVMSVHIDLSQHLPEKVYLGFSASTGSDSSENNCVKTWFFEGDDIVSTKQSLWVWIAVPTMIVVILSCGTVVGCLLYKRQRSKRKQMKDMEEELSMQSIETGLGPKKFKLKELKGATGNFSPKNELGRGGFGIVYKGNLDMKEVAVKKIINKHQGKQNLIAEITTIGSLHHKNLVKLIGWCFEKNEFLLVYEYMPNGSLDMFICSDDENMILSWERRHGIICGVAQSLDYLHHECSKRVLHRDIKTSNIMLDSEFNARLGDFGLARMFKLGEQTHHSTKELMGTPGYMAPEIFLMGHSTAETDVFAFGVLVLVVISGRAPGIQKGNKIIVDWVWELHKFNSLLNAVDPRLKGEFDKGQAECMLLLGLACCHPNPYLRPSMRNALQVLMGEALPPSVAIEKPVFMWPATPCTASLHHLEDSLEGQIMLKEIFTDIIER